MNFKRKFMIGDFVKHAKENAPESKKLIQAFVPIPMREYRIYAVLLSCSSNQKNINYQLEISGTWEEEVKEEELMLFN